MAKLKRKKKLPAFTLFEVMTTIAIVGIMSSIAFTSVVDVQARQDAALEFTQLENLIREARNSARTKMRCVKVETTATTFSKTEFEDCSEATTFPADDIDKPFTKISNITTLTFKFNENGEVVTHDDPIVIAAEGEAYEKSLTVYPAIGTIRRKQ